MAQFNVDYTPTPKQTMFHGSTADEVLFGGAAGGGKSKAIVMDAFFRYITFPGTHAFVFRRTYSELEDTVIKEAKESYPFQSTLPVRGETHYKRFKREPP